MNTLPASNGRKEQRTAMNNVSQKRDSIQAIIGDIWSHVGRDKTVGDMVKWLRGAVSDRITHESQEEPS